MRHFSYALAAILLLFMGQACQTQHKVEMESVHRIQVEPMHITIDINIKVDKALDNFFGDLDEAEEQIQPPANQTPAK
jgi:hypothetical protein